MIRYRLAILAFCIPLLGAAAPKTSTGAQYEITPVGDWVLPAPPVDTGRSAKPDGAGASEYLLVDRQMRIDHGASLFSHYITRPLNPAGVTSESQLSLEYDPETEHLHIHSVTVKRGGERIDELKRGRIEVLRRESGLEDGVLDGSLTFHLVMADVRVGDIIDVEFTLERTDPEWGNRFYTSYHTNWDSPVKVSRLLVHARTGQVFNFADHGGNSPEDRTEDGWRTLTWRWRDIPAVAQEAGAPSWYPQYARIEFSQFANWQDVASSTSPLYVSGSETPELRALITRFQSQGGPDREKVVSVMRFVQDDIRYTGVELGVGAFRPSDAATVLKRRWGDCKDKSMLAVTLLRALGIDAAPALVNTRLREHVHDRLPSPGAFDHAIVRVRMGGFTYWLDATTPAQGGDLDTVAKARFGAALVVSDDTSDLEPIPDLVPSEPLTGVTTVVDLRRGYDKPAIFSVSSVHRDFDADSLRETLRDTTPEKLATNYLNYYKQIYPGIRATGPLQIHDDRATNELRIDEMYEIDAPFEASKDGKQQSLNLRAELISGELKAPTTPLRKTPLALPYPTKLSQQVRIELPASLPVEDDADHIETPTFQYQLRISHTDAEVRFAYQYQTLADHVPLEQLPDFVKQREAARVDTYFHITVPTPGSGANADLAAVQTQLANAAKLFESESWEKADVAFDALLRSEHLNELEEPKRHAALFLAGLTAYVQDDFPRAHGLLKTASESPSAGVRDWLFRWQSAVRSRDWADATYALTTVARKWPENVSDLDLRPVATTVTKTPALNEQRYQLLKNLADANFSRPEFDPSPWWRDLSLLQIQHGERSAAIASLSKVTDPETIVSVLADGRFSDVRNALPKRLDVAAALQSEVEMSSKAVADNPSKLEPVNRLLIALLTALRTDEALRVADDAIKKASSTDGRGQYKDYAEQYSWLLNTRSQILFLLGRWDESIAQLQAASRLTENGASNVSQVINLGGLYNHLSRPKDARNAVKDLDPTTLSPYGQMEKWDVQLSAALQVGDANEANTILEEMRTHQEENISVYEDALVMANRLDEAAKFLISRLQNPEKRIPALMSVQHFDRSGPAGALPRFQELKRRWDQIEARADVRAAIAKIGSVDTYPMLRLGADE